jgi:hypothetical protein
MSAAQQYPLLDVLGWSAQMPAWAECPLIAVHDSLTAPADPLVSAYIAHCLQEGAIVVVFAAEQSQTHYAHTCRKLGASLDAAAAAGRYRYVDVPEAAARASAAAAALDDSAAVRANADVLASLFNIASRAAATGSTAVDSADNGNGSGSGSGSGSMPTSSASPRTGARVCAVVDSLPALSALLCNGDDTYALQWLDALVALLTDGSDADTGVVAVGHTFPGCVLAVAGAPAEPAAGPLPSVSAPSVPAPSWTVAGALAAGSDPVAAFTADTPPALAGGLAARLAHRAQLSIELRPLPSGYSSDITGQLTITRAPRGSHTAPAAAATTAVRGAQTVFLSVKSSGALLCHTKG